MSEATTNGGRVVPHTNGKASYAEKHQIADHFIGGNKLANAPPSKVKDFVAENDGHTVITNVRDSRAPAVEEKKEIGRTPSLGPLSPRGGGFSHWKEPALTAIFSVTGPDCQQRYRRRQGDPVGAEMGIRDLRRREGHPVHCDGHSRRFGRQC